MIRRAAVGLALLAACGNPAADPERIEPPPSHREAMARLARFIDHEMRDKEIPGLSIAVLDGGVMVWARGFGDADSGRPATAATVHRVGSVSKLFTDLAVMQLVEDGRLALDLPVATWLPDFRPANPYGGEITLRHLMSHRAGLVREPPAGNYFDPTPVTLEETVASLNRTTLLYPPGERSKYSNAGIAVVGLVVERVSGRPFAEHLADAVLRPAGMTRSAFRPETRLAADLARAVMWTQDGRSFPAPTFELGMAPAGSMYSTVLDLGRFMQALFARGAGPEARMVSAATLEEMWRPQFTGSGATEGFGLGFHVGRLHDRRVVGHGGAIYGFATALTVLPDDSLGVAVIATKDVANTVADRIASFAVAELLGLRGVRVPRPDTTGRVPDSLAVRLTGLWESPRRRIRIESRAAGPFLEPEDGPAPMRLRTLRGDTLITDDAFSYGLRVRRHGDHLIVGGDTLVRTADRLPAPPRSAWLPLLGEYGWEHNTLYVLERDGRLHALIEWFFRYPLEPVSDTVWRFPARGLYPAESLVFRRGADGRVADVIAAGVRFSRRAVGPEEGEEFRITPTRPVSELRKEALDATPPVETGDFLPDDLVDPTTLDPGIRLDVRYATRNNFMGEAFYSEPRVLLQRPAAEAVARAHRRLRGRGYGLLIHDGWRPWYVTKMFWEATPESLRIFVADPSRGSRHNRGAAIDLTLYDLRTGRPVDMPGGYDEFSPRSYPDYPAGTSRQRWHRRLLREAMEAEGFTVYEAEWWHFDHHAWREYRIQ